MGDAMGRSRRTWPVATLAGIVLVALAVGCAHRAVAPSWTYATFKDVEVDPFPGMSFQGREVALTADELKGRIVWNLWTGDNAGFWDWLASNAYGAGDLLKVIAWRRGERFQKFGVMNQPGYVRPAQPDEYGLHIDVPREPRYDVDRVIDRATYGRSSGIMGLRLFPNPRFDAAARARWNAERYLNDPTYYNDKTLVRPYVVGMTCSFCHTGPDPVTPPADPAEPEYANLNDYVGQHFMKVWEVFGIGLRDDNFIYQILRSNPPGTLDTSFIATDYLNNPGTMNGIFEIAGRLRVSVPEQVTGGARDLLGVTDPQVTPRVLKEGADSVGFAAALSRVYLNIGEYWEEWLRHFNPMLGVKKQSPIRVADAQRLSPHWNWSESRSPALAAYFVRVARPLKLAAAPGGGKFLTTDAALLDRGKRAFARHCAGCHSSKQPPAGVDPRSPEGQRWFEEAVMRPDFLDGNFLGSEVRYPVTLVKTNATRAVASNALRGQVWDNFSSETYKTLPGVGTIDVWDPFTGTDRPWEVPGGGRGYYRPPSLVSLWASAPFFHNNALGKHVHGVTTAARMEAFDDAVTKLLWPERRLGKASIWRTSTESWLQIPRSYLPAFLGEHADPDGNVRIGPIPEGTPINLLANTNLEPGGFGKNRQLARLLARTISALKDVKREGLTGDAATRRLMTLVPDLYQLNTCPDFVEDRGHYFGTDLPDADKRALIEYLKTM
jgi:hypothetical protein